MKISAACEDVMFVFFHRLDFGDEKRCLQEQIAEDKQRRLERSWVGTTPTKSGNETIKQTPHPSVVKSSLVSTCRVQAWTLYMQCNSCLCNN